MARESREVQIDRLLLGTDLGERTVAAEQYARQLAIDHDARLVIVHAIEPIGDLDDEQEQTEELHDFYEQLEEQAESRLRDKIKTYDERGIVAEYYVHIGYRWRVILDSAEDQDVDLIVLGRRAFDNRESISLGTTSQKVYFGTQRPVLLVPEQ